MTVSTVHGSYSGVMYMPLQKFQDHKRRSARNSSRIAHWREELSDFVLGDVI